MPETLVTRWSDSIQGNWTGRRADCTRCLVCIYPVDRVGQMVKLEDSEVLIGRDADCDVELSDDSVSRRHAVLRPVPEGFVVIDLASTNGTYVNDIRIDTRPLQSGDRLRLGNQIFKYLSADRFEAEFFENAYRMMTTDGLTQAYNKRYLFEVAERELRRVARSERPLSLLMIDIDQFKAVNDSYGHLAGDEVLIEVSQRLRSTLRGDEVFARYGGEEFCLLMPDASLDEALQAAERMRSVIADAPFATEQAKFPVTVSIGAAGARPDLPLTILELIELADRQLYAAKNAGRNRVMG